jgi:VanZ family protein
MWMGVIYILSTSIGSPEHTGRFIEPLLRWFKHDISRLEIRNIHLLIRKMAHVIDYAVLAILLWSALAHWSESKQPVWSWKLALCALALATVHGAFDEFHQLFEPGRVGCVRDVLIDSGGGLFGILLMWLSRRQADPVDEVREPVDVSAE